MWHFLCRFWNLWHLWSFNRSYFIHNEINLLGKNSGYVCKAEIIKIKKLNMLVYIGKIDALENNSKFYSLLLLKFEKANFLVIITIWITELMSQHYFNVYAWQHWKYLTKTMWFRIMDGSLWCFPLYLQSWQFCPGHEKCVPQLSALSTVGNHIDTFLREDPQNGLSSRCSLCLIARVVFFGPSKSVYLVSLPPYFQ